jgi:glutamate-1-semialdehyde 2,1-aminomutase
MNWANSLDQMTGAKTTERRNAGLDVVLEEARERLVATHPESLARHRSAAACLPGGNTRAVLHYEPFPLAFTGGHGCRVSTLDGPELVDMISEYSAGLYGHSDPVIAEALKSAVDGGIALGGPNVVEARYAAALVACFPALERVRFCNSGTEANIMALSTARAVTGRTRILAMAAGYHGGVLTFAHGGSPLNLPFPFSFATYNDVNGTRRLIRDLAPDLAAVILEPMMGGGGCIPATPEFLAMIREETAAAGALMILDEVMTSRLDYRALHGALGLRPDLLTMGKYLGGGASFGCFGGRADIMDLFDPARPGSFSHGGTFNNNILSLAAGLAGFTRVRTEAALTRLNALGDRLREQLNDLFARHRVAACATGRGSLMTIHFVEGPVTTPAEFEAADPRHLGLFHVDMLLRGFYVAPRGMIALSLPFGEPEFDAFLEAIEGFLTDHRACLPWRR